MAREEEAGAGGGGWAMEPARKEDGHGREEWAGEVAAGGRWSGEGRGFCAVANEGNYPYLRG